ncbi:MAG: outer membrane protein transport protein [Proteobacteria bacterium]|nr:outer membrane protein transport protein [Pseudomonadota bacterium]
MPVWSAGIAVMEQSVKELGQAFSGAPTNIDDGSMVFFNPAAMSQVRGRLVSVAGYVIAPSAVFQDSASHISPLLGGAPLKGGNGGDSPNLAFAPNVYYVQELTNRIAFGFGFNTPFGMSNSYSPDWKGRYQALDSEILTFNFNPSLSFKVTEKFSFGAGFDVQYLQARLTNAIDLGPACFLAIGPTPCASRGILPQAADGHVSVKGDSVGFGYNFGAFYALNQDTRLGVSYRSRVVHDIHGNADFSVPDKAIALTQGNTLVDSNARTSITLPDSVLFGFTHRLNPRWAVSADALWTHWSLVRELRTSFSSAQPDDVQSLKLNDTWRYAFGVNYFADNNKWTWRMGFAYDETPISSAQNSSPRIPDSSRYWLTAGLTYAVMKNVDVHAAYAHLFMNDAAINRRGTTADSLVGQYSEQINIGGLQLDWRF